MKYVCLGYYNEKAWEGASESEQNAFMDACLPTTIRFAKTVTSLEERPFRLLGTPLHCGLRAAK